MERAGCHPSRQSHKGGLLAAPQFLLILTTVKALRPVQLNLIVSTIHTSIISKVE